MSCLEPRRTAGIVAALFVLASASAASAGRSHAKAAQPPLPSGLNGTYVYDDAAPGPERSEQDEQAATRACDGGDWRNVGTVKFNACMYGRDWVFSKFEPASDANRVCRVADSTGRRLNVRAGPRGRISGVAIPNGTPVRIFGSRFDAKGHRWAFVAHVGRDARIGWVFQRYISCP
jgi:hypothetical protein